MKEQISHIDYQFTSITSDYEERNLFEIQGDIYNYKEFDEETIIGKLILYSNPEELGIYAGDLLDLYNNKSVFIGNFHNKNSHTLKIKRLLKMELDTLARI